jgi:hypothetical protein
MTTSYGAVGSTRRYYLDWLRVMAMLSIFFYHSDGFFDFDSWLVKNTVTSLASTIHTEFFEYWMMPLFFIISGAAVYYSLRNRNVGGFVRERSLRILIPWILLGIFVMAPPQIYLMRVSQGEFPGGFFQFYPHYFEGVYPFGGNFAFHGMHLWYLMDLFIFSLLLLPLFIPSRKTGESLISMVSHLFAKPWALLLLFVPIAATSLLADLSGLGITRGMGSWDILSYMLFFILGYLIFSNTPIQETIRRLVPITFVMALVLTLGSMYIQFAIQPADSTMLWLGMTTLRGLVAWCWIITTLGFGSRFLNSSNRFLAYANEAILPFYILHQTVIVIIGFYVVQWNMGIAPKYAVIATTSFISIMAIYELLVKRVDILRFLFGMRLKKKTKAA